MIRFKLNDNLKLILQIKSYTTIGIQLPLFIDYGILSIDLGNQLSMHTFDVMAYSENSVNSMMAAPK